MTQTTAIYVIAQGLNHPLAIETSVRRLSESCTHVAVIHEPGEEERFETLLGAFDNVALAPFQGGVQTPIAGYQQTLLALKDGLNGPVILTGSHVFSPIGGVDPALADMATGATASYWHDLTLDSRLKDRAGKNGMPDRVPYLDYITLSPAVISDAGFWPFWESAKPSGETWEEFTDVVLPFGKWLAGAGHDVTYATGDTLLETADPRLYEVHKMIAGGGTALPVAVLLLDPVLHDLNAIELKGALDHLRGADPEIYAAVVRYATRHVKMREFTSAADQYEVISDHPADPAKSEWGFGTVAVFIHAFYADMMPEFWDLIARLPAKADLFITTATEENANGIRDFLRDKGWDMGAGEVRVVEQNRGRDMSSLFITWRDIVLDGGYEIALRLHSKRTPQVSRQVGNSFRDHMFDNLANSPGYVRNVLDRMESEPDVGLIIPPVIHIGFGTLGHAWYNNKEVLHDLCREMSVDVPLDDHTPVAAYGTMYWFRPQALAKMFEWRWKWEDYNPEPHHIDGGLAHVQERLIAYCVQDKGFRVLQVMTPEHAARGYAKLEYKLQLLASFLGSHSIYDQRLEMAAAHDNVRIGMYRRARLVYGRILRKYPASRAMLKPVKNLAVRVLAPGGGDPHP